MLGKDHGPHKAPLHGAEDDRLGLAGSLSRLVWHVYYWILAGRLNPNEGGWTFWFISTRQLKRGCWSQIEYSYPRLFSNSAVACEGKGEG